MKGETWQRIDDCVADALELPVGERRAFVSLRLGDDSAALADALRLIGQAEGAEKFFSKGPMAGLLGLSAGSRLGPWELVRPLGTGGMGVVWLAKRVDGQAVMMAAIKLLPPALSGPMRGDSDLLRRFLVEKQILARLQHPNIARLLDAGAGAGESPNFVMEYVEGVPLMEFLRNSNTNRLRLFLKICSAVQYAHANLVVHRDLKPQNILVEESGEPKLLDFGIGKVLNDPAGDSSITLQRAFSLDYASPEQIRGGLISTATDVYSLGLILFEMLTEERGRRWHDKSLGEVLEEAKRFELPAKPGLSADLVAVLRKATEVEESRRYRSVGELAGDVARVMDRRPVEARAAGVLYQVGCFARRNLIGVVASSLGLFAICALGIWGWLSAGQARTERSLAVEQSRQLQIALDAEQAARLVGEEQSKLARHLGTIAKDGEARAEARVRDLLKVFSSVIVSARWDVSKLPGGLGASIKMLEQTLAHIDVLEPTPAAKASFLLLRAEAHTDVAELYGGENRNVGNADVAKRHLEKSVELRKELHNMDPKNVDWKRGLLDARFRIVRNDLKFLENGDLGPWWKWTREYERLLALAPKNRMVERSLASFYFWRGRALPMESSQRRGDWERSLQHFQQVMVDASADPIVLRDVAVLNKYLATAPGVEPELRMRYAMEAVRIDRLRSNKDKDDAGALMDLAFSVNAVADVQNRNGDYARAQLGYLESYEIRKGLAIADPNNSLVMRSLLFPIRRHSTLLSRLKDWKTLGAAVKEFEWAAETSRPKGGALDFASLNYWKGLLARENGDRAGACQHGREATRLLESEKGKGWIENPSVLAALLRECEKSPK